MRISRFVSIIIIITLIFCSTSYIFASNVNVTNQGNSFVLDRETITSSGNTDIGGLLSRINEYVVRIAQRLGPVSGDGGINTQLYNMRTMIYSIMQNVINYLGPVTTPSGSKALNELTYMIWDRLGTVNSTIAALGPSVDGTYTNSSLILAQDQTQTSHLANIRTTASSIRDELKKINWRLVSSTFNGISDNGTDYSIVSTARGSNLSSMISGTPLFYSTQNYIIHVKLPTGTYYPSVTSVTINTNQNTTIVNIPYFTYFVSLSNTEIYFLANVGSNINSITVHYSGVSTLNCNTSGSAYVEYLLPADKDYFIMYEFLTKQDQMVSLNQLISNTSGLSALGSGVDSIIDLLDKSTSIVQNDNEVTVHTNIHIDDINFFNSISRRFHDFFNTGITAAAFGLALDSYSYDAFFKAETVDLVQTVHNQYTEVPLVINDPGPVI